MTHSTATRDFVPPTAAEFLPHLLASVPEAVARELAGGPPRDRLVPRHVLLWYRLAAALDSRASLTQVFARLLPGFAGDGRPSASVLAHGRVRLGWLPRRRLAHHLRRRPPTPRECPSAVHRGLRLVAVAGGGPAHVPQVRLVARPELGTRTVTHGPVEPVRAGEVPTARGLIPHLEAGQLLLHDAGFQGFSFTAAVHERGAHLPGRVPGGPLLKSRRRPADGSDLARLDPTTADRLTDRNGPTVRVIESAHDDPTRARGRVRTRPVTTLLDPKADPARTLVAVGHRRWDQELAVRELKTHPADRRRVVKAGRNEFPTKKPHHRQVRGKPFQDHVRIT